MTRRPSLLLSIALLVTACPRSVPDASPEATFTAASSSVPHASAAASAPTPGSATTAAPTGPWAPGFAAFHGTLHGPSETQEMRLAFDRRGAVLEALYGSAQPGEQGEQVKTIAFHGEMRDRERFVLEEQVGVDTKGATVQGRFVGDDRVEGTWKGSEDATGFLFSATRFAPLAGLGDAFDASYEGRLGKATRLRAELHRAGTVLQGTYRYAPGRQDLQLHGTVTEPAGLFALRETTESGAETGRIEGIFLGRDLAFGRWSTPDHTRVFPISLRSAGRYAPVALEGGGRVMPDEILALSRCAGQDNGVFPRVTGLAAKAAETALNQALHEAARAHLVSAKDCEDAKKDEGIAPWTDVGYAVTATHPGVFALELDWFVNGGAHGNHGRTCFAADTTAGKLVDLRALLTPDARKKLGGLLSEATLKYYGVTELARVPLAKADVDVSRAALCALPGALLVQIEPRPPGHNWDRVELELPAVEARPLFDKSDLADALFGERAR